MMTEWPTTRTLGMCVCVGLIAFVLGQWIGHGGPPSKTDYKVVVKEVPAACPAPPKPEEPPAEGRTEVLTSGFVRVINTDQKLLVIETDYGFIKALEPYCWQSTTLPVWVGMRVQQVNYRWIGWNDSGNGSGCYSVDYIGHAAEGDLKTNAAGVQKP
jgi:hypothetical protein